MSNEKQDPHPALPTMALDDLLSKNIHNFSFHDARVDFMFL
jgi:hypothetical protein